MLDIDTLANENILKSNAKQVFLGSQNFPIFTEVKFVTVVTIFWCKLKILCVLNESFISLQVQTMALI